MSRMRSIVKSRRGEGGGSGGQEGSYRGRAPQRLLRALAVAAGLLVAPGFAAAQNVLLIWDVNVTGTQNLKTALEAAGMTITLSTTNQTSWDGTNPSTTGFCAVVHLNGTTYDQGMPATGQVALVNFVQSGGGYLGGEWNAFDLGIRMLMRDLILFDRVSGREGPLTYSDVPAQSGHPVLANVPSTFSFSAGANIGPVHVFGVDPATVLMTDEMGSDAVAVRDFGLGRVVNFNHAGNYNGFPALSDPNVQQLYIDGVKFACGCGNGVLDAGEECDDGNPTNGDGCSSRCTIEPCMPACADGIACTDDVCLPDSANGGFVCAHNPIDAACDDDNACTDDRCDSASGCFVTQDDTNPCDDGDACNQGEHCSGGACTGGGPILCNDGNPCTDDLCSSATGCFIVANNNPCNDFNACTSNDVCSFGTCSGTPNNAPCNDGNPCSTFDTCNLFGACQGGPQVDCNDNNPCTTEFCQQFFGCVVTQLDGIQCEDHNPCTTDDACHVGLCTGDARNCLDDDPCTVDSCNSAGGAFLCQHEDCDTVGGPCPAQCSAPRCGNGQLDPGETCDPPDPTLVPERPGHARCRPDCTSCGDGQVQSSHGETCDDGNLLSGCNPARPAIPLDACQNACTAPICHDPSTIKFRNGPGAFTMHGQIIPIAPATTLDPRTTTFVVQLTDANGVVVFRSSLEAGLLQQKGLVFSYLNPAAEELGGFSKLKVRNRRGAYLVTLRAYGDLSRATERMTTHIFVGSQEWTLAGRWVKTSRGWRLDLASTFQGS